ncbi:hypothetical protein BH23CHL2_BH23CHL2_05560 [soil metagenome]
MTHLMPRPLRHSILIGILMLMGVLAAAPAAGAAPIGDPPLPPIPPSPPSYLPDLIVEDVSFGYGYLGWHQDVRIRNQSNVDVFSSFYVRDDSSWNKTVRVSGLAAGSHITVRFYRYSCEGTGTVHVDAFRQIPESKEHNNSKFWAMVC